MPKVPPEKAKAIADSLAKKNGQAMTAFFSPPTQRGRRAKAAETRGRPASKAAAVHAAATGAPGAAACAAAAVTNAASKPKQTRVNWSKGDNAMKLSLAVAEWTSGTGRAAPREFLGEPEPRKPSLAEFAALVDIPKGTIGNYVTSTEHGGQGAQSRREQRPVVASEQRRQAFCCGHPSSSGSRQRRDVKPEGN